MIKFYIGFGIICAGIVALVIYGFIVAGTPSQRQAMAWDSTRMSDLSEINYSVDSYYSSHNQLPATLSDVTYITSYNKDPQTSVPYSYEKIDDTSFKLCAIFSEDSSKEQNSSANYYLDYSSTSQKTHKKGYDCLTYTVPSSYIKKPTQPPPPAYYFNSQSLIKFKDVSALAKTKNNDPTAFSMPAANAIFYQGNSNIIQSKYQLPLINLYLIDLNNNAIGQITPSGSCTSGKSCIVYWDGQLVKDESNNLVNVKPGNYKIIMIQPANNPLVLGGVTNQFVLK